MRGRPKKPDEIKKLEGTFRKDRTAKNPMLPAKINGIPKAPGVLYTEARPYWKRITTSLYEMGMLYDVDLGLLAAYCNELSRYYQAVKVLKKDKEFKKRGVALQANNHLRNAMSLGAKFGFTPSDRTKIEAPASKSDNPFDEFEQ